MWSIRTFCVVVCLLFVSCGSSRSGRVELLDAACFDTILNGVRVGVHTLSSKDGMADYRLRGKIGRFGGPAALRSKEGVPVCGKR